MKAKEKGIADSEITKGRQSDSKYDKSGKFNAFREMAKLEKGQQPSLARIQDGVAVVGKPIEQRHGGVKRERTEDGDDKRSVKPKIEVGLTV